MSLRIVIIGAGEVGFNLAKTLSNDNCDLTIIDIDPKKCQRITNSLDAHVINGDGASQRILQDLDLDSVDYLLALSRIDEVNLVASKSAFEMGVNAVEIFTGPYAKLNKDERVSRIEEMHEVFKYIKSNNLKKC